MSKNFLYVDAVANYTEFPTYDNEDYKLTSAGAGDTALPVLLDAAGHIDATMVNDVDVDHDDVTNTHNLTTDIDHDTITNGHNLTTAIDHDTILNNHNLTTNIDHDTILNNHNLTTNINHNTITNNHDLTSDIDHDQLLNFVADEHIDWTADDAKVINSANYLSAVLLDGSRNPTGIIEYDSSLTFTTGQQVVDKAYVDSVAAGMVIHDPVRLATTAALAADYDNGTAGVGATLTNNDTQAALSIDSVAAIVADRILVKDQTGAGTAEITTVTAEADSSRSLDGSYWWLFTEGASYYSWYSFGAQSEVYLVNILQGSSSIHGEYFTIGDTSGTMCVYFDATPGFTLPEPAHGQDRSLKIQLIGGVGASAVKAAVAAQWADGAITYANGAADTFTLSVNATGVCADGTSGTMSSSTCGTNVQGYAATSDPAPSAPAGKPSSTTGIQIALTEDDTANTIAGLTATAVNGNAAFGAPAPGGATVTVTHAVSAEVEDAQDGDTGWTAAWTVTTEGQDASYENGIYTVTTVGTGSTNWVLTRAVDFDHSPENEIHDGDFFFVTEGTSNSGNSFNQTENAWPEGVVGETNISFGQFTGAGQFTVLSPLEESGSTWNLNASAADKYLYSTGADTWTEGTIGTFGRSLIDDADAAGGRTTLGIGTIGTQDADSVTITGGSITGITDITVADGGTGASSLTDHGVLFGSGTSPITPSAVGTNGQLLIGQSAADPTYNSSSGDITVDESGVITIGADVVHDSMIDWGTGAGNVSAVDVPILDSGGYFITDEVESALQELGADLTAVGTSYAPGEAIAKGDLVFLHTDGKIYKVDIDDAPYAIGAATEAATAADTPATIGVAANDVKVTGASTITGYANPGDKIYWEWNGSAGGWNTSVPTGTGKYIWMGGVALSSTSYHVEIRYIAKRA